MSTRHLSLRLDSEIFELLEARSHQSNQPRSRLARALLEVGLRMETHPGIVFRSGPSGRRAGLAGGPDVWEVVRVLQGSDIDGDVLARAAELTGLTPSQVEIAARYYADYRKEIDNWIQRVDEEAARAEAAWRRAQDLLRR